MLSGNRTRKQQAQRGFTLVEFIVSVSIFTVVATIGVGSILTTLRAYRQTQAQRLVIDNLSSTLDAMTRRIRIGSQYHCGNTGDVGIPQDCENGASYLAFEDFGGNITSTTDQIIYSTTTESNGNTVITLSSDGGATFAPITSPEIDVQELEFSVFDTDTANARQPYVVIKVHALAMLADRQDDLRIQTVVSQRLLNN